MDEYEREDLLKQTIDLIDGIQADLDDTKSQLEAVKKAIVKIEGIEVDEK